MSNRPDPGKGNRRTLLMLGGLVAGMFAFGFAMVPLYGLFCQLTGTQSLELRSAIGPSEPSQLPVATDSDRQVVVKFDTNVHPELPWEFHALERRLEVQPGRTYQIDFEVKNRSSRPIVGQAIASVTPWQATGFFSKLECFCFQRQPLGPGESKTIPLRFVVMPDLPEDINSLTLSYIFMNTGEAVTPESTARGASRPANATAG